MIERIHVKNYVLIDSLDLDFRSNFIAISGETGSGKSILLGALSLLLGAKADKSAIRNGYNETEISASFYTENSNVLAWCEKHGIEVEDNTLVLRRIIKAEGRSLYTLNGTPITRVEGEEIGLELVDFSSQHSHHSLMRKDVLRSLLDENSDTLSLLSTYRDSYKRLKEKEEEINELKKLIEKGKEERDYIEYCLEEIEKANLISGEEDELKEKLKKQGNSEFLFQNLENALDELKSVSSSLSSSLSSIAKAEKKDSSLSSCSSRVESLEIEAEDIYETIRDYVSSLSFSEIEIEQMNSRLSTIQRLKRRFNCNTLEDLISIKDEYKEKLGMIDDSSSLLEKKEKEEAIIRKECEKNAEELSLKRRKGALSFQKRIEDKLHNLAMDSAKFIISVEEDELGLNGKDKIDFLLSANKGEKISSISECASGGEMSRIYLAIKASSESRSSIETMIFDEIDSGLGGETANCVRDELSLLGKKCQVIIITHLPQLASKAEEHFLVKKEEEEERTVSRIKRIEGEERTREIARLLSGNISSISLEHAKLLLNSEN